MSKDGFAAELQHSEVAELGIELKEKFSANYLRTPIVKLKRSHMRRRQKFYLCEPGNFRRARCPREKFLNGEIACWDVSRTVNKKYFCKIRK